MTTKTRCLTSVKYFLHYVTLNKVSNGLDGQFKNFKMKKAWAPIGKCAITFGINSSTIKEG